MTEQQSGPTDEARAQNTKSRIAVIDVGSNSTKMYVAEVEASGKVERLRRTFAMTRLGAGLDSERRLTAAAIAGAVAALRDFAAIAAEYRVVTIKAVATQFAREAVNISELQQAIHEQTGIVLEVISGEEEARLAFVAAAEDFASSSERILVFNTGGGSTELIYGLGAQAQAMVSVPLGAVYLTRQFPHLVGVNTQAGLAAPLAYIAAQLRTVGFLPQAQGARVVGNGGGMRSLASIAAGGLKDDEMVKVHLVDISHATVRDLTLWLAGLTSEQRRNVPGLEPDRVDIIVAGGLIAQSIMEAVAVNNLTFSARNLRDGLIAEWVRGGRK